MKDKKSIQRAKSRLDAVWEREELDAKATTAICEVLTPDADGNWPHAEVLLYAVEHPMVADAIADGSVPDDFLKVVSEAIRAVAPLFESCPQFPLAVQIQRLRRAYDRERRKFELVSDKLADGDDEGATQIAAAYVETSPAPYFMRKLKSRFSEAFARAESDRQRALRALSADERLVELLRFERPFETDFVAEISRRLDAVARQMGDVARGATRGLQQPQIEKRLVAGALAVDRHVSGAAGLLLRQVCRGGPEAGQAAAFAGWLTPSSARHVLGRFLVDVLNDGTPGEEYGVERRALRRSIVAARTVLPLIDSPVDDIEQIDAQAEDVARTVKRAWQFCEATRL